MELRVIGSGQVGHLADAVGEELNEKGMDDEALEPR